MADRILGPKGRRRRKRLFIVLPVIVAVGLAAAILSYAGPVGSGARFEDDDANLVNDTPVTNIDWNSFAPLTWPTGGPPRSVDKTFVDTNNTALNTADDNEWTFKAFEDRVVTTSDSGFAGGTKQDNDCATVKDSKAPNKDDLKRIYLATTTSVVDDHVYLMLGWVRIPQNSTTASAHIGFEFNQGETSCGSDSPLVERTGGDMLVVYNFAGSGAPEIKLSRWLTTDWVTENDPDDPTCEVNNSTVANGCWGDTKVLSATPGVAEGAVFTTVGATTLDALKPDGSDPGTVEFGEGGIDLTDAGVFDADTCAAGFGSAYAVSRSSGNSSQAQMMDRVGPGAFEIDTCASLKINKTSSDSDPDGIAGAVFTLYEGHPDPNAVPPVEIGDLDVVGTCTMTDVDSDPDVEDFQCINDDTGEEGFEGLEPGDYTVDETTVPAGYNKDSDLPFEFTLDDNEDRTLSFENAAQPGSVSVVKVDDSADENPVGGAVFRLFVGHANDANNKPTTSGLSIFGSCTTNSDPNDLIDDGTCEFTNVPAGNYTIDEISVPAGYDEDPSFPRQITVTNGTETVVNAEDPRRFKAIVIVCRQADNTLYPSGIEIDDDTNVPDSLSADDLTGTDLDGLEEDLCAITAGAKGGLHAEPDPSSTTDDNPYPAEIDIPNIQP